MNIVRSWHYLLLLGLFLFSTTLSVAAATPDPLSDILERLKSKSFTEKAQAVEQLAASGWENSQAVLEALLTGHLYYLKKDRSLVLARKQDRQYALTELSSGSSLGLVKKREIKKITSNNKLRAKIRTLLAGMDLSSADAGIRKTAVEQMLDRFDPDMVELLRRSRAQERHPDVRSIMDVALALADLQSGSNQARLTAIDSLDGNMHPQVRNSLVSLQGTDDPDLSAAITKALNNIDAKLQLYGLAETAFFGLSLGSVLVLAAIGLAITFGVMGVINMAHGELIMIGAYTTYVVQLLMPQHIAISLLVAVPAAFLVSGLIGIAIERGVIRFLYGRPLETLLATFGISLVLQQAVRSIFSPLNRSVETPQWMSGSWEINSVLSLTLNRLYIIVFCLIVFSLLFLVLKKTALGLQVRAVSQNRAMARAMGVRSEWVDAMTFGLGSGIAGVAGVALSQLTNVGPNLGQAYIIDSFMVVVFGGVGNLWGTLVSGMTLGVANKFLEPWSGAVLAKILVLVFIILFIQKRPRGLFPQKGRAAEA